MEIIKSPDAPANPAMGRHLPLGHTMLVIERPFTNKHGETENAYVSYSLVNFDDPAARQVAVDFALAEIQRYIAERS